MAQTAVNAYELISKHPAQYVISCTKFQDGNGIDLLKHLRQQSPAPFIFLTDGRSRAYAYLQTKTIPGVYFSESLAVEAAVARVVELRTAKTAATS
jgi:DNA-binding NarL/FixJ family response regulator